MFFSCRSVDETNEIIHTSCNTYTNLANIKLYFFHLIVAISNEINICSIHYISRVFPVIYRLQKSCLILYSCLKIQFKIEKAMPQGSDQSPAKNRNEICHSLCMKQGGDKSWRIIRKWTIKTWILMKKLVHLSDIWIIDILTTKTFLKHRGAVFDDIKRFPWQWSSDIIFLLGTYTDI